MQAIKNKHELSSKGRKSWTVQATVAIHVVLLVALGTVLWGVGHRQLPGFKSLLMLLTPLPRFPHLKVEMALGLT